MTQSIKLTRPQHDFVFSKAKFPALIGGLGCVHPCTKIWTEKGLMRIADISSPIRVLSWNEKNKLFQYSQASASFIKGQEVLKKIITNNGSFIAANNHKVFTKQGDYKKISEYPESIMQMVDLCNIESIDIISIEDDEFSSFYDIRVENTNNYVCEHGFIHHNSGKSQGGTYRIAVLMLSDPGISCAYYFPTYDLIRLRGIPGLIKDLETLKIEYTINKTNFTVSLIGYGDVIFRSYDSPDRIVAYEVAHSIVDELDTLEKTKAEYVWRKIVERNRQECNHKQGNTVGCVTTPDRGKKGFVFDKWGKTLQDGYELIKASTYSNPFLPADYADNILKNYDKVLARLYLEGDFVSLSNLSIIKEHWWQIWNSNLPLPRCEHIFLSWDTAFSEADVKNSAHSACTRWGVFWHEQQQAYCLICLGKWHGKVGYDELRQIAKDFDKAFKPDGHLIEKKATGISLIQDLRRALTSSIRSYLPNEDKISRAYSVTPMFKSGQIFIPYKRWATNKNDNSGLIEMIASFPDGAPPSADLCDTVTQACIYLRSGWWVSHPDDEDYEKDENKRKKTRQAAYG